MDSSPRLCWHTATDELAAFLSQVGKTIQGIGDVVICRKFNGINARLAKSPPDLVFAALRLLREAPAKAFVAGIDEDLFAGWMVKVPIPRGCGDIWLAALEGKHPTMQTPGFAAVRDQLEQRFLSHPEDVDLLGTLGMIDAFLGRESEAIEEATRAMKLVDGVEKDFIRENLAQVYTWTHQPDLAFHELALSFEGLDSRNVENQKANPEFDPIRNDPRFEKLGAQHQ